MIVTDSLQMQRLDALCISSFNIPGGLLMENAATAALLLLEKNYSPHKTLIVCGSGNNGGDGLALARKLHAKGWKSSVVLSGKRSSMSPESRQNFKALESLNIPLYENPSLEDGAALFRDCALVVDALLGTGLSRDVEGDKKELIRLMNESGLPIVSLDIPSGIDGSSGKVRGLAVQADKTICFGSPKRGNVLSPGFTCNGELYCSTISFPPEAFQALGCRTFLNLPGPLAPRNPLGYKNSFGRVLVIGGSPQCSGAPALAAMGAYRCGAGYVTAAVPSCVMGAFSSLCPEGVLRPLEQMGREELWELASRQDCVLLGPGLGDSEKIRCLVRELIPAIPVPLVLDADGLNALAGAPELCRKRRAFTVLTPHRGEEERLMAGLEGKESLAELYGAVCVHKGPHSRIVLPDGREYINLSGNEALGSAGSGDVLAGMLAALIPWAASPVEAVQQGVLLHGLCADWTELSRESFCAGDIVRALPSVLKRFREEYQELHAEVYGKIGMIL